jgi:cadmium resistance protein CadD (predicted permease)
MVFFSQTGEQMQKRHIIFGQYLGMAALVFIGVLGAMGLNLIPQQQYTGLLGIVPILLGVRIWLKYKKAKKAAANSTTEIALELQPKISPDTLATEVEELAAEREVDIPKVINDFNIDVNQTQATTKDRIISTISKLIHPAVLNVFLVTIANGADNIGVYIPLFTRLKTFELVVTILIFMVLTALWCLIGEKSTNFPSLKHAIQKYKSIIVPIVFIMIGIYILIKSGLFILLFEKLLKSIK